LTAGDKSKLSLRDTATCSATSHNQKIVQSLYLSLCLKILIDTEDLTNSGKSFQTDGEAKLNAGCETFNLYSGFDYKFSELQCMERTGV